jgi:hypothetical protein
LYSLSSHQPIGRLPSAIAKRIAPNWEELDGGFVLLLVAPVRGEAFLSDQLHRAGYVPCGTTSRPFARTEWVLPDQLCAPPADRSCFGANTRFSSARQRGAIRLPYGRAGLGKFLAGMEASSLSLDRTGASGMASNGLIDWAYERLCAFMGRIIEAAEEQAARYVLRKVNDLRRYRVASL